MKILSLYHKEKIYHNLQQEKWKLCIREKLKNLVEKAAKIKEESKILSTVMDWLEFDDAVVANTPAFDDWTQAKSRQLIPSIQRVRTGSIARDASIENCVQNLNLRPGEGPMTIAGDELSKIKSNSNVRFQGIIKN